MVFFDQHRVEQADAVVGAATSAHRIFLCHAQTRQGFARVHNLGAVAGHLGHGGHKLRGAGGHGAEQLQKIQGGALGGEQGAGMGLYLQHHRVSLRLTALGHVPAYLCIGVQRGKGFGDPIASGNHRRLAHPHPRAGPARRIDQRGSQITRAHVFQQRARHVLVGELLQERSSENKRISHERESRKTSILDARKTGHKKGRS